MAQLVKNLSAVWETWVRSLGWKDALEKGKATHSSILAWRIQVAKSQTRLSDLHFLSCYWQRQGHAPGLDCLWYKLHQPGGGFSNTGSEYPLTGSSQGTWQLPVFKLQLPSFFAPQPYQPFLTSSLHCILLYLKCIWCFLLSCLDAKCYKFFCIRTKWTSSFSNLEK